jgi:hypothetical protein
MSTIINSPNRLCVIIENRRFMEEAATIRRISELAGTPASRAPRAAGSTD